MCSEQCGRGRQSRFEVHSGLPREHPLLAAGEIKVKYLPSSLRVIFWPISQKSAAWIRRPFGFGVISSQETAIRRHILPLYSSCLLQPASLACIFSLNFEILQLFAPDFSKKREKMTRRAFGRSPRSLASLHRPRGPQKSKRLPAGCTQGTDRTAVYCFLILMSYFFQELFSPTISLNTGVSLVNSLLSATKYPCLKNWNHSPGAASRTDGSAIASMCSTVQGLGTSSPFSSSMSR